MVFLSYSRMPGVLVGRAMRGGSPFGLMRSFQAEVDEMLGAFAKPARLKGALYHRETAPFPRLNIEATDASVTLRAELPGASPNDISIEVFGDTVTISGGRQGARAQEGERVLRGERFDGEFRREVKLPFEANPDGVEARYTNGILELLVPRAESSKPRKITVKG